MEKEKEKEKEISYIYKLAKYLHSKGGSDIIINADSLVVIKVDGKVIYLENTMMTEEKTEAIARALVSEKMWESFIDFPELNFMQSYPDIAYFRTNIFRQRGKVGMVMRLIPLKVPSLDSLNLPEIVKDLALVPRGLVLFTGATGSGKSTSLSAMLGYRNETQAEHIITVEDPIEFIHTNKRSIITQREVGGDTNTYATAMKSALRQAPDTILVGEIRDMEVMEMALAFSETGHMVYATLHATNAPLTLDRIINMFPHERREQLCQDLANSLKAVVTQRLMTKTDGKGRIPALEIMTSTPHIKLLIRDGRLDELKKAMSISTLLDGVITMDNYIFELYEKGDVDYECALKYVDSTHDFNIRVRADSELPLPEHLATQEQSWVMEK